MSAAGKVPGQSRHDRRHFRVGALERHARLQPHEAVEEVIDVVLAQPLREPEVAAVRRVEVARRHAGNRRRDFREPDRLADDRPDRRGRGPARRDRRSRRPGAAARSGLARLGGGGGGGGTKFSCVKPPSVIGRPNSSKKPSVTP